MSSKYYYNFSSPSVRRHSRKRGIDGMFAWTIFIFLLIGFALFCWMGSFYIFGHPEKASNYRLLKRLHKIEEPQRFEITSAPRGEFLKPAQLLERFSHLSPYEIKQANTALLRNFVRNYHQTRDLVPYAVGTYKVLHTFPLTEKDFVYPGVVALLQAAEQPEILLEQVFPSEKKNLPELEQSLQTGQEIKLNKPLDLSAIIFVDRLHDGRIKLTTMPLLYGTYGTKQGKDSFSLEPPSDLRLEAGPPLLTKKEISAADKKYYSLCGKSDFSAVSNFNSKQTEELNTNSAPIMRIITPVVTPTNSLIEDGSLKNKTKDEPKTTLPSKSNFSVAGDQAVNAEAAIPVTLPTKTDPALIPQVLPALAVNATPTPNVPHAIAVNATPTPSAAIITPSTTSPAEINTATTPMPPIPRANTTGALWPIYDSGKMPRGRLVDLSEISPLAERGIEGERLYLQGNFSVTAAGQDKAVLRYSSAMNDLPISLTGKIRIIVSYPFGTTPPTEGTSLTRDQQRPFMITETKKGTDGTINIYVREITRP